MSSATRYFIMRRWSNWLAYIGSLNTTLVNDAHPACILPALGLTRQTGEASVLVAAVGWAVFSYLTGTAKAAEDGIDEDPDDRYDAGHVAGPQNR